MRVVRSARVAIAFLLSALVGACVDPAVDACRQQCDKRAACDEGSVDVDQCHVACDDSELAGDEACVDAQLALSRCQVALACDDYLANAGCDDESAAVSDKCTP